MAVSGRFEGRIALITGASRGIGAAVAKRYAREGAHVILLARTAGGLEEVDDAIRKAGGVATLFPCDLRKLEGLDPLGPSILDRFGGLDIFVANAAVLGVLSPLGHIDPATWRRAFEVNVHANWRLIRTLDPLLKRSSAGRAIFVTDGVASKPLPYWGVYGAAKAALEHLARTWAAESAKTPLKVNLIEPGPVATRLRAEAFPGEAADKLRQPEDVTDAFVELASPDCQTSGRIVELD
ncbi:MAG: SDR family NAD(P)-dependent oxidoreductase [Alphaproteobacteria bacterium]